MKISEYQKNLEKRYQKNSEETNKYYSSSIFNGKTNNTFLDNVYNFTEIEDNLVYFYKNCE